MTGTVLTGPASRSILACRIIMTGETLDGSINGGTNNMLIGYARVPTRDPDLSDQKTE